MPIYEVTFEENGVRKKARVKAGSEQEARMHVVKIRDLAHKQGMTESAKKVSG